MDIGRTSAASTPALQNDVQEELLTLAWDM
jgi:hypothetical protein